MKKIVTFAVILSAAAALSSCALENTIEPGVPQPINLTMSGEEEVSASGTRATPLLGTTLPNSSKFVLYGYNRIGSTYTRYIDNVQPTVTTTTANFPAAQYWPITTDGMNFFCYYPTSLTLNTTMMASGAAPTMAVNHAASSTNYATFGTMTDPLYAHTIATANPVSLTFKHALSRITFQCRVDNNVTNEQVKVKSVTINSAFPGTHFTVSNTGDLTWSKGTKGGTYTTGDISSVSKVIGSTLDITADTSGDGGTYTNIFAAGQTNNSFLMVPMTTEDLGTTTLTVVLTVGTVEKTYTTANLNSFTGAVAWEANKHVNYQLVFDLSKETNAITIGNVTVQDWGTQQNVPVTIN